MKIRTTDHRTFRVEVEGFVFYVDSGERVLRFHTVPSVTGLNAAGHLDLSYAGKDGIKAARDLLSELVSYIGNTE